MVSRAAASTSSRKKTQVRIGRRSLELSNLQKILYPEVGFTKGDVITYYRNIAPVLIPHLKERAVTLKRYPDGVEGSFFYEKRCPPHRPPWVKTIEVVRKRDNKPIPYCLLNDEAALVWAANLANLELHTSLARARDVLRPTSLVFDLDPDPDAGVLAAAEVALWVRVVLDEIGLDSVIKTSGSKGMQIYVPLNTKVTYADTGPFALAVARLVEQRHPDRVVTKMKKELRTGKVLIDWSQNDDHKTTVSVYSLRARTRPTVSTPLEWDEVTRALRRSDTGLLSFDASEVLQRVERGGDLFAETLTTKQKLSAPEAMHV